MSRTVVEKDLPAKKTQAYVEIYKKYFENEESKKLIEKIWENKTILITYPNLKLTLENGTVINVKDEYPEIKPYYYNFRD